MLVPIKGDEKCLHAVTSNYRPPNAHIFSFALEVFDVRGFDSREAWKQEWLDNALVTAEESGVEYNSLMGDTLSAFFQASGCFMEALYDWGYGATQPIVMPSAPQLKQPAWPSGKGFGRTHAVMTLTGRRSVYKVNYSNEMPNFSIIPVE